MSQKQIFDGTFVLLGFGSIGNAGLDIIFDHIDLDAEKFFVVSDGFDRAAMHQDHGVAFVESRITEQNLDEILDGFFKEGPGILVNASVNICSKALIGYCQRRSILYVDTSFEIWADQVGTDDMINNGGRFSDIQTAKKRFAGGPTAITCHGANPGIVSHFAKRLVNMLAQDELGDTYKTPRSRTEWAKLAQQLGITSLIITEMDSQRALNPSCEKIALNTWSIHGLLEEASEKICVPFGTHEPVHERIAPFVFEAEGRYPLGALSLAGLFPNLRRFYRHDYSPCGSFHDCQLFFAARGRQADLSTDILFLLSAMSGGAEHHQQCVPEWLAPGRSGAGYAGRD